MNVMRDQKERLRGEMLKRRQLLSPQQAEEMSRKIVLRLDQFEPLNKAGTIMAYASIKNEVDLEPWLELMVRNKKKILLPRVDGSELQAVPWQGWENCSKGAFNIKEPRGMPCDPGDINAVLVPGVAFDRRGYRLGYGRGYYDRFLRRLSPAVLLCGTAYEFQLVESIFPDENDVPLHWIITEQSEVQVDAGFL